MNTIEALRRLSHLVDAMEALVDKEQDAVRQGSPTALSNIVARLDQITMTIEEMSTEEMP